MHRKEKTSQPNPNLVFYTIGFKYVSVKFNIETRENWETKEVTEFDYPKKLLTIKLKPTRSSWKFTY